MCSNFYQAVSLMSTRTSLLSQETSSSQPAVLIPKEDNSVANQTGPSVVNGESSEERLLFFITTTGYDVGPEDALHMIKMEEHTHLLDKSKVCGGREGCHDFCPDDLSGTGAVVLLLQIEGCRNSGPRN